MINRKRIFKIAGITIVVIILLTLAGSFLFSYLAKKKIKGAQIGNFQLESKKINTNLFRRQIRFSNAKLTTENSRNNIVIPEARLSGIKLLHLIFSNEMEVKKFKISGPTINFYKKDESKSSATPPSAARNTGKKRVVLIHHLEIPKLQFHFLDEGKNKPDTVFSTLLDFNIWELNTDSASHGYSKKKFGFSRAKLFAEKGSFKTSNGLFNLHFDKMGFDTEAPNLIISRLEFNSPYGKYELGQQTGVETNWYDISIDSIQLNNFDVAALIKDTAIIFGNSSIKNIDAEIFRDKHLPFPDKKDTKLPS
ncbi:MAG TPA: hypothetical protein VKA10_02580, partial [Prolixibacteraceae bacterium]|nr:hypothetical protein [Prolixibacteraceae bacterium]